MRRADPRMVGALTLLETVVAISLIAMLISALLSFYTQSVGVREQAALAADRTQIARQVLERLASELRGCIGVEQWGFPGEQRLVGERRRISFVTAFLPDERLYDYFGTFDRLLPGQHDLREIAYELWVDPHNTAEGGEPLVGGIVRTEKRTLNQFVIDEEDPLQIRHDLWSHELGYLEFRYFDGVEWATTWDVTEGNPLPHLIQITVGFGSVSRDEYEDRDLDRFPLSDPEFALGDNLEHLDRYSTIVRIQAADRLFSSRLQRVGRQFSEQMGVKDGL
jgi:hypothetical protein